MIDIKLIIENPKKVEDSLKKKGWDFDSSKIIELDKKKRELLISVENNKAEQNKLSASVPQLKKEGKDVSEIFKKVGELKKANIENENLLNKISQQLFDEVSVLPNMPDDDLLSGGKENNKVIETFGCEPKFDFKPKDHVALAEDLGLIDYERGAKISGHGTWVYKNLGARLEWALINFFISEHLSHGWEFILPPHLLNEQSGFVAGQFPKFKEDVFHLADFEPNRFMLPTAETALVNLHRDEILKIESLPKKYFAYTPCYRKEAGSYRSEERGMIRGYQFNKVEMVQYTSKDDSDRAFNEMVEIATNIMKKLGLCFRLSKLAAGDCSHSMARTYDIEVFIPSVNIYKEVSSVSNARDYQARRGKIRYKDVEGKTQFCHTLNGSGLATSRLFPAILEQFQNEDGSVTIPEVLRPFMGGLEKISK